MRLVGVLVAAAVVSGVSLLRRLTELRDSGERGVLFTVVEGDGIGGKELLRETGERIGGVQGASAIAVHGGLSPCLRGEPAPADPSPELR